MSEEDAPEVETKETEVASTEEAAEVSTEQTEEAVEKIELDKEELQKIYSAKNRQRKELVKAKKEAAELRRQLNEAQVQPAPKPDDFEDYDKYTDAKVAYEVEKATRKEPENYDSTADFAIALKADGARKYEDFEQVAFATKEMLDVLQDTDAPDDIAYYLGKNPVEAQRLIGMDDRAMLREFTKIEIKLTKPKPITTNAPEPVRPLETDVSEEEIDEDSLSIEEWTRRRNKQRWAKGKI